MTVDNIIENYDDLSIPDLEDALEEVEPSNDELDTLLEYEKENKDRKGAKQLLEDGVDYDDWGETYDNNHTKGGFRKDEVTSLLQKAIRRSQDEEAAWAAWELMRSGYSRRFWRRMQISSIEDLGIGQNIHLLLYRYEMMAKHEYGNSGWAARLIAIHAAVSASRARSSREATYSNGFFERCAEARVRDEEYDIEPVVEEEDLHGYGKYDVAIDKHTYWGRRMGRSGDDGWRHFRTHGERIGPEGETEMGENFRRQILSMDDHWVRSTEVTDEEIDHSLKPTDEDGSWEEDSLTKQTSLSAFEDE